MMPRVVAAEALDSLTADDPAAIAARRDLQRVHRAMGTRAIVARALQALTAEHPLGAPLRLLELGAGDGSLMLEVAQKFKNRWPVVECTLLDRLDLVRAATIERYAALGWKAAPRVIDVFDWAASPEPTRPGAPPAWDLIVCNLFLHHFEGAALDTLLAAIAGRSRCFFACEPRRAPLALAGSHLIAAIGAHAVTREDAVLSVNAGFQGQEISALWPGRPGDWTLKEYPAGLFSHCFCARQAVCLESAAPP
jgi:hypothetical protein